MSLLVLGGILWYLTSRKTNKEQLTLPPWGYMSSKDMEKIQKNKHPFLTRRIIQNTEILFYPLDSEQVKHELYQIREYNQMLNQKVDYGDKTHYDYFKQEDTKIKTFEFVVKKLNDGYRLNINMDDIIDEIYGYEPVILTVKQHFNKLRPFQASALLRIPIKRLDSDSADTPSLPSGHSIQAMLFGAIIYRKHKTFFDANPGVFSWLVTICLDVGRRRIIAGLHFPSDHHAAKVFVIEVVRDWDIPRYVAAIKESQP